MSSLDAKLEEIVIEPIDEFDGLQLSLMDIEKIKQAFKDDGWIKVPPQVEETWRMYNHAAGFMTGQEWYDRFNAELAKPWGEEPYYQADDQTHVYTADHVHEAMRKAAGIE